MNRENMRGQKRNAKNKRSGRFIAKHPVFILVLAALIILGGFRVSAMASSANEQGTRQYTSVQLNAGDTLWSLAETYGGSSDARDIRAYVKDLKEMNHILDETSLKPGAYVMVYTVAR